MGILKKQNEELKMKVEKIEKERDAEMKKRLQFESEKKIFQEEIVSKTKIISQLESAHNITKQELHNCGEELQKEIRRNKNLRRRARQCQNKLEDEIEVKEEFQQKLESFRPSWGDWSACSKDCPGVRTRMDQCLFDNKETEPCNDSCSKSG